MKKPEFTLIIPDWKVEVELAVVKPKYYKACNKTPESIKKKYNVKNVLGAYHYVDSEGKPLIKNTRTVGKPRVWRLNGQSFYSNTLHWSDRSKIVTIYHNYFKPLIEEAFKEQFPTFLGYSLSMHVEIFEIYSTKMPDITNMWILPKIVEDSFVNSGILKEDAPEFRTKTSFAYTFVKTPEDRKLEIKFSYRKNNDV